MTGEGRTVQSGDEDGKRIPVRSATRDAPWINGVEVVDAAGVVLLLPHETGLPICDCPVAVVDELRRCAGGRARPAYSARARERLHRIRAGVAGRAVGLPVHVPAPAARARMKKVTNVAPKSADDLDH